MAELKKYLNERGLREVWDIINGQNSLIVSKIKDIQKRTTVGLYADSTSGWAENESKISEAGALYIYTDAETFNGKVIAKVKIGDGTSSLADLSFIDAPYSAHIADKDIHFTAEERAQWNNEISAFVTAAGVSADTATQAASRAETSKTAAETAATQAETARQGAETARAEAVTAQNAAKISADLAASAAQQTTADKTATAGYAQTAKTNADSTAADKQAVQTLAEQVTADKATVADHAAQVAEDRTAAETAAQTAQAVADSLPDDYTTAVGKIAENTAEINNTNTEVSELKSDLDELDSQLSESIADISDDVNERTLRLSSLLKYEENILNPIFEIANYKVENDGYKSMSIDWFTVKCFVNESTLYNFWIFYNGTTWIKSTYYTCAFYDINDNFTHGGDLQVINGDFYVMFSFVGAYKEHVYPMLLRNDVEPTNKTSKSSYIKSEIVVKPKMVDIIGLSDALGSKMDKIETIIDNPFYFKRYTGNMITTEKASVEGAFIKFDSITFKTKNASIVKTWNDFKTDVINKRYASFMQSYDLTEDCFAPYGNYYVTYNMVTNSFDYYHESYGKLKEESVVLFYSDTKGNTIGEIYEQYKKIAPLSEYSTTIADRKLNLVDKRCDFSFLFATDVHWYFDDTAYRNVTNDMIRNLENSIGIDCYINGGDSIYYGTKFKKKGLACLEQITDGININNMVYCVGNHDFNGVSSSTETNNKEWNFTRNEYENLMMKKQKDIVRQDGKFYFYRDFADKKMRVISLDTSDTGFTFETTGNILNDPLTKFEISQDQLNWIKSDALNVKDGWNIIIVMHVGLYMPSDGFPGNNYLINSDLLKTMLKSYVNKSGDFASYKGNLVCILSGHAHEDGYCNKDGFNAIQTVCSYPDRSARLPRTIDELAVECVFVDAVERTITLKRFGYGNDREYSF